MANVHGHSVYECNENFFVLLHVLYRFWITLRAVVVRKKIFLILGNGEGKLKRYKNAMSRKNLFFPTNSLQLSQILESLIIFLNIEFEIFFSISIFENY